MSAVIDWLSVAADLERALRSMPCTCVKHADPWPFKIKEHKDHVCRRCASLARFDAATKVVGAA